LEHRPPVVLANAYRMWVIFDAEPEVSMFFTW
jgi:hypothetical protein